ncbi:MAG: hypothetical protein FWC67_01360 [Defluviitaleaceae bacterium]|nr:hypothetical protein [Defluviitaleaceae bacterium]
MIDYSKLNRILGQLKRSGKITPSIGLARAPEQFEVRGYTRHALIRAAQRGIPETQIISTAQKYVDTALVMFVQGKGRRRLYVSNSGNVAVFVDNALVATLYTKDFFDQEMHRIITEVMRCMRQL